MILSEDQFNRQALYDHCLHLACLMHKNRLLTDDEFDVFKEQLIQKYNPIICH